MVYTEVRAAFTILESGMNCEGMRVGFILHGVLVHCGHVCLLVMLCLFLKKRKVCLLIGIRSIWLSRSRCKDGRTFPKCGAGLGNLCPRPVILRRSPQWGFYPPHNPMYQHGKCITFYECAHNPSYQHGKSVTLYECAGWFPPTN
jgi:hypothetical protein